MEKNGTSNSTQFTDTFKWYDVWICPNLTSKLTITLAKWVQAEVVYCDDQSEFDTYAQGTACSGEQEVSKKLDIWVNTVSTNFNEEFYSNGKMLQLKSDMSLFSIKKNTP